MLYVNEEDYSYRFYKNLNEDVKLISNECGEWDIDFDFENDDWINVRGYESVVNACIIAIMTRFDELQFMSLYDDFGCRVHELIKSNKSRDVHYKMELFITETLNSIRRIAKVNWVEVTDNPNNNLYAYRVNFSVVCKLDEDVMVGEDIVEGSFLL